jgi:hypothetical protein
MVSEVQKLQSKRTVIGSLVYITVNPQILNVSGL